MSRIIFIEDNQYKIEKIRAFFDEEYPQIEIVIKKSFHGGFEEVIENAYQYDLMLLDMSMQNYDITQNEAGGDPAPLAGKSILTQMFLREIELQVVVVTMYEKFEDGTILKDLNTELSEEYPDNYKGYVIFSHGNTNWKNGLREYINNLL